MKKVMRSLGAGLLILSVLITGVSRQPRLAAQEYDGSEDVIITTDVEQEHPYDKEVTLVWSISSEKHVGKVVLLSLEEESVLWEGEEAERVLNGRENIQVPDNREGSVLLELKVIGEDGGYIGSNKISFVYDRRNPGLKVAEEIGSKENAGGNVFYEKKLQFMKAAGAFSLTHFLSNYVYVYCNGTRIPAYEKMIFEQEGNYQIEIKKAFDEQGKEIEVAWDNVYKEFEIDRSAPIVETNLTDKLEYLKQRKQIMISIQDKNFINRECEFTILDKKNISKNFSLSEWEIESEKSSITLTCEEEGDYKLLKIIAKDAAGNEIVITKHLYFKIDRTQPVGNIALKQIGNIRNGFSLDGWCYLPKADWVTIKAEDENSGIKEICYNIQAKKLTRAECENLTWVDYKAPFCIVPNRKCVIYAKIKDYAGNIRYLSSEGIIFDDTAPFIHIAEQDKPQSGIYKKSAKLNIFIEDRKIQGTASGIDIAEYEVCSQIHGKSKITQKGKLSQGGHLLTIDRKKNNSNFVKVRITARDKAGNKSSQNYYLKIDADVPNVSVILAQKEAINGKYFNKKQSARILITERNFSSRGVCIKINGAIQRNIHWKTIRENPTEYEGKIDFEKSGTYRMAIEVQDKAGNKCDVIRIKAFVVDLENPKVRMDSSAKEAKYSNKPVKITISIIEKNFNRQHAEEGISVMCGTRQERQSLTWKHDKDIHIATFFINWDGAYQISFSYTDLSGRRSNRLSSKSFVLDQKKPSVHISGITKFMKKEKIYPQIEVIDSNLDFRNIKISIVGERTGVHKINTTKRGAEKVTAVSDMRNQKDMSEDDCYTIRVIAKDKAGNREEIIKKFYINRNGSVFTIENEKVVQEKYTKKVDTDILLSEENVTPILEGTRMLWVSRDGEVIKDVSYDCKEENTKGGNRCQYIISAGNFAQEGIYRIRAESKDKAGNKNNTVDKGLEISFAVDHTPPKIFLANLQEDSSYYEQQYQVEFQASDNIGVKEIFVYVDGRKAPVENYEKGYRFGLEEGAAKKKIQVICFDHAGNQTTVSCQNVLVTTSKWVKFVQSKRWLIGLSVLFGILLFIGIRRLSMKHN